jgi:hypothetical protein
MARRIELGQIQNVLMTLLLVVFFLSCSIGTAHYNNGEKDIDSKAEKTYNEFIGKWIIERTPGIGWDEQFVLDVKNAAYHISATTSAVGIKFGYDHPSNIYPWLAALSLPVMFASYFLYLIQYFIAMVWVGWDKVFGGRNHEA